MTRIHWSAARLVRVVIQVSVVASLMGCAGTYHHMAGMRAMDSGDFALAVSELRQAADADPRNVRFRTDWLQSRDTAVGRVLSSADRLLAGGNEIAAAAEFRRVLILDPDNAMAHDGLMAIQRRRDANAEVQLARTHLGTADYDGAMQRLRRALELAPDLSEAKELVWQIEARQTQTMLDGTAMAATYQRPIDLEFRDASLKSLFEVLSRTTGISFVLDREVKPEQRTTVFLRQTTLEDALDVLLVTNQLDKKVLSPNSVLIYPKTAAKAKEYQDLVVRAFYLATAEAKQTAQLLKTTLKIKEIFVDDKLNMLVLRESSETIALAEKLVALHDLDEPEVMLDVEVLEISRNRLLDLGIKWSNQLTVAPLSAIQGGNGNNAQAPTFKIGDLKNLNSQTLGITTPSATISLRKEDGDANLLANPRIRVRDREKAKILIGDKLPVVTTTTTPNGFLSESIQYLDVGLKLEVEPNVHLREEIGLRVNLEVSSLVATVKTANGTQAYQIGTRSASSALRLRDGETQVLAGLISDEDRSAGDRIPLLGDVPLLGRLFSSQKDDRRKTEIVLSITPHLVRPLTRRGPAAEVFFSGTEANLRTTPLQLRSAKTGVANKATTTAPPAAAPAQRGDLENESSKNVGKAPTLRWNGPQQSRIGEPVTLQLWLDSEEPLRATPLQIALDLAQWDVASIEEGDYFKRTGQGSFNQVVDPATGKITIGTSTNDPAGASGSGHLLTATLKPKRLGPADLAVVRFTPGGTHRSLPALDGPLVYRVEVTP